MKRSAESFVRQLLIENEPVASLLLSLSLPRSRATGKTSLELNYLFFAFYDLGRLSGTKYLIIIFAEPLRQQQHRRWAFRSSSYLSPALSSNCNSACCIALLASPVERLPFQLTQIWR